MNSTSDQSAPAEADIPQQHDLYVIVLRLLSTQTGPHSSRDIKKAVTGIVDPDNLLADFVNQSGESTLYTRIGWGFMGLRKGWTSRITEP